MTSQTYDLAPRRGTHAATANKAARVAIVLIALLLAALFKVAAVTYFDPALHVDAAETFVAP